MNKTALWLILMTVLTAVTHAENPAMLPPGKRGYILQVSTTSASTVKGQYDIDVFVTYDGPAGQKKQLILNNARNIPMIAIDYAGPRPEQTQARLMAQGLTTLTLAVDTDEAVRLQTAQSKPNARFSVRAHPKRK